MSENVELADPSVARTFRAMIYFVVAALHFYRDSITPLAPGGSVDDYIDANGMVLGHVRADARSYFDYDLTDVQIERGVEAYLAPGFVIEPKPHRTGLRLVEALEDAG